MAIFYLVFSLLFLIIVGLCVLLFLQQRSFELSRERLEQKLLARDLTEYVDQKIAQEPVSYTPPERDESEIYMDIEDLPESDLADAVMQHAKDNLK